jgi:hypothetical protein
MIDVADPRQGEETASADTVRQRGAGPARTPYYYLGRAAEVWWTAINKQATFVHRDSGPR